MKWIIENLTKEKSYLDLADAAERAGVDVVKINRDYNHSLIEGVQNEVVVISASIEMGKILYGRLKRQNCAILSYCSWEKYLCTNYYPHFGDLSFNDNYVIVPLSEISRRKWFFWGLFGKEGVIFMRPDDGDKPFKAGLWDIQDWDREYEQLENKDQLVIVSSPKNIHGEWRFLCNDKKEIIAVSSYRFQNLITRVPSAPQEAYDICNKVLDRGYFPDPLFCVDVALDSDKNGWLMELTSFSSAGLYEMDKDLVVKGVLDYVK